MCRPPIASGWLRSVAPWEPAKMHVHLPKPLHGWRAFVGEVGIIVIGVLIALGAEQVVETVHWNNQVADSRITLDEEMAHTNKAFAFRVAAHDCIAARLSK